jgi:excisionase family DNA binding protein
MEKLLNPSQLAEVLNVKPGTIYSWICRGVDLPPFIKIGGSIRWQERTVMAWIAEREREMEHRNFGINGFPSRKRRASSGAGV